MRTYTNTMLEQLSGHIQDFNKNNIPVWLDQAAEQFHAIIVETSGDGMILQLKGSEMHVGAEYFGDSREEKEINMFYHFINNHYGTVIDGKFVASLNYENEIKYPVFG